MFLHDDYDAVMKSTLSPVFPVAMNNARIEAAYISTLFVARYIAFHHHLPRRSSLD